MSTTTSNRTPTAGSGSKGGPKTETGKAVSSKNALSHGLSSQTWLDDTEQSQYDDLIAQLSAEYSASGPTMALQIERLAMAMIKIRRLQKIENALYEKAKITVGYVIKAKPQNSTASYLPNTPAGKRLAERIAVESALPDLDRLDTLARYQVSLDRQISKIIGEIQVLHSAKLDRVSRGPVTDSAKLTSVLYPQSHAVNDVELDR